MTDDTDTDTTPDGEAQPDDTTAESDPFAAFRERETWSFEYKDTTFRGSEPEDDPPEADRGDGQALSADDKIMKLMLPSTDARVLHWRIIKFLHDEPEISFEDWQGFSPRDRHIIADRHAEAFGLDELRGQPEDEDLAEILNVMEVSDAVEWMQEEGEIDDPSDLSEEELDELAAGR